VFLIDEAHNLLDRGREMYSAALFKDSFLAVKKLIRDASPRLARLLDKCNRELLGMKRSCETYREEEGIDGFVMALNRAYSALDDFLDEHETFPDKDEILEFYFEVAHFLNMYEIMDGDYVIYSQLMDDGDFMLKLFCVDPSKNLRQCMEKGRSTILFSATLLPIQYYKKLLGGGREDYEVYAKSTFNEEKKLLLIANDVTSMYTRRTKEEFGKIARYIYEVVRQRYGNYMVFFPSHLFLEQVYECFMEEYFDGSIMECLVQEEYMSEARREEFLMRFQGNEACDLKSMIDFEIEEEDETILIGFCVMGGIFSEGIDLKHDSLIGAVIVGTGIPQVGSERELLKKYFDGRGENGFDYAYRYPGMNKVLQSAGRVIRTAQDIGVVALLDERFLKPSYLNMFPREWASYETVSVDSISGRIEKFWDEWL
jgi:Rad3-related DNA helicase